MKLEPPAIEPVVLRDAEMLEQLGAAGILRAVARIGRDYRLPAFSSVLPVLRQAAEQLPPSLRLTSSREPAGRRLETSQAMMAAIEEEAGALLF